MRSLSSWLLAFFMVIFWAFRIVVTLSAQFGGDFGGFIVFNSTIEIVLLFVSLLCFILIVKRIIWGGIIYFAGYAFYFGSYIINEALPVIAEGGEMDMMVMQNVVVAIIGLILGLCIILDIAIERVRSKHFTDNKTDWYFGNDKYDRKLDDRADKNQYRTL